MALKRCMDRVILKNCKLAYAGVYSDSEADEFAEPQEKQTKIENKITKEQATTLLNLLKTKFTDEQIAKTLNDRYEVKSTEELNEKHGGIPHGGFVIRTGKTGKDLQNNHIIEYSLKLDSNPEFTASVIVAYARAVYKFAKNGDFGCKTVFDVPPAYLSLLSNEELRKKML